MQFIRIAQPSYFLLYCSTNAVHNMVAMGFDNDLYIIPSSRFS